MWINWLPWRLIIKKLAKGHGFIDPVQLISAVNRMAQPSEVAAPVELLRLAAVLHARGLINSQVIQHNLDWIWPFWVNEQFNHQKDSFIPRSFALTHINLTHRNWTGVGLPGVESIPIIDPKGLITPLEDGWSIDSWIISEDGYALIPSKNGTTNQKLYMENNISVKTDVSDGKSKIKLSVKVEEHDDKIYCKINAKGIIKKEGWLVISLRPYNPEGISFIHEVASIDSGWLVNKKNEVIFDVDPQKQIFSNYKKGDVFHNIFTSETSDKVKDKVGLCTAAALFKLNPEEEKSVNIKILLEKKGRTSVKSVTSGGDWTEELQNVPKLKVPDEKYQYLYQTAVRNLILFSPDKILAGPYTYKQFWIRDAVYALNAMLCLNLQDRAKKIIDTFYKFQKPSGYFKSQDGEWDSNGQVLWILKRYYEMTGEDPEETGKQSLRKAVEWIRNKRVHTKNNEPHDGLFLAGFSAEHFGPNDYYYWDDFWGVAGLEAAEYIADKMGDKELSSLCQEEANDFFQAIENSLKSIQKMDGPQVVSSSPYRRLDSSAVGSLVAGYPLKLYGPEDEKMTDTAKYLLDNKFFKGLFFHEIAHSGMNIYLSLHIAQVLLRCGDPRFIHIMEAVANNVTDTGQWPEAIHPWTGGGCMGDGQHLWASTEWIMILRNCFIREEKDTLIVCSGIPAAWLSKGEEMYFGPAATSFGSVSVNVSGNKKKIKVEVEGNWRNVRPRIELRMPGYNTRVLEDDKTCFELKSGVK